MPSTIRCARRPTRTCHLPRSQELFAWAVVMSLLISGGARAQTGTLLFESASYVPTTGGGVDVFASQFLGERFQPPPGSTIRAVGGHLRRDPTKGDGRLFAALVKLTSITDFPDSSDLSTPDVLAHTTFQAPSFYSDVVVPIDPVSAGGGGTYYGLVFGTGLFGTSGEGFMALGTQQIGTSTVFARTLGLWNNWGQTNLRFTAYSAVPEPTPTACGGFAVYQLLRRTRARRLRATNSDPRTH